MAVTQALLPDEAPMVIPDNVTFRQLQHIDIQQAAMDQSLSETQQQCEEEYPIVREKLTRRCLTFADQAFTVEWTTIAKASPRKHRER
ncbi:hypothetical protein PPTG_03619 [Phytophthora nicotianae INRA-310]|uniref:Uncharacterized protein n=1 Tax=Phytophthora nicotianae (strain INRA-310) TaxID=761204 RepID=W2R5X3_PHYN3|nr:hypothetical protein PPTG_03619 [Phytophthora nicotianae INRA-310]ETN20661.1 hypothetical protein PPTG_03619 [Phytophthora nicotianae INRA-310]